MALVNIKIEGKEYQVDNSLTVLEAAKTCGYEIPSLCAFNHGECNSGSCRASCVFPAAEGLDIHISSPKAVEAHRRSVELLLSNHNMNCQQCDKNGKCELTDIIVKPCKDGNTGKPEDESMCGSYKCNN